MRKKILQKSKRYYRPKDMAPVLTQEINALQELLNRTLENESIDSKVILDMSRELDKLIVLYHRYKHKKDKA